MLVATNDSTFVIALFVGVPAVATLYLGVKALMHYRGANASMRWREVGGEITKSKVKAIWGRNRRSASFSPEIHYRYKAIGNEYEGDRVYFGADGLIFRQRERSRELVERYPVGKQVRVFVNPLRPEDAVLEQGQFEAARESLIGAVLAAVLTSAFAYGAFR